MLMHHTYMPLLLGRFASFGWIGMYACMCNVGPECCKWTAREQLQGDWQHARGSNGRILQVRETKAVVMVRERCIKRN